MKAISYTAARQNLAKTMERVCKDHAPIIITRKTTNKPTHQRDQTQSI